MEEKTGRKWLWRILDFINPLRDPSLTVAAVLTFIEEAGQTVDRNSGCPQIAAIGRADRHGRQSYHARPHYVGETIKRPHNIGTDR